MFSPHGPQPTPTLKPADCTIRSAGTTSPSLYITSSSLSLPASRVLVYLCNGRGSGRWEVRCKLAWEIRQQSGRGSGRCATSWRGKSGSRAAEAVGGAQQADVGNQAAERQRQGEVGGAQQAGVGNQAAERGVNCTESETPWHTAQGVPAGAAGEGSRECACVAGSVEEIQLSCPCKSAQLHQAFITLSCTRFAQHQVGKSNSLDAHVIDLGFDDICSQGALIHAIKVAHVAEGQPTVLVPVRSKANEGGALPRGQECLLRSDSMEGMSDASRGACSKHLWLRHNLSWCCIPREARCEVAAVTLFWPTVGLQSSSSVLRRRWSSQNSMQRARNRQFLTCMLPFLSVLMLSVSLTQHPAAVPPGYSSQPFQHQPIRKNWSTWV
eukprot:1156406-Pelagomonas_calceolata.AAC.2